MVEVDFIAKSTTPDWDGPDASIIAPNHTQILELPILLVIL